MFLIATSADNETMLEALSRTTALGVKVSIVPRLFEVIGSAVEFDTVGGVTRGAPAAFEYPHSCRRQLNQGYGTHKPKRCNRTAERT